MWKFVSFAVLHDNDLDEYEVAVELYMKLLQDPTVKDAVLNTKRLTFNFIKVRKHDRNEYFLDVIG